MTSPTDDLRRRLWSPWPGGIAVLMLLALSAACNRATAPRPAAPPSIILVSVDTLRADHLGSYGYERATSPRLDALAAESVRFAEAFAPTPWTLPSHVAMLTGVHPWKAGFERGDRTLAAENPTLAELLSSQGYETAAFVDSPPTGFVGAERGFARGFDRFEHYTDRPAPAGSVQRFDMTRTVDAALEWIDGRSPGRPFFLFLHTKSVHAVANDSPCRDPRCFPYDPPDDYRFRFIDDRSASFTWSENGEAGQRYLWALNAKILRGELDPATYPSERVEQLRALYDGGILHLDSEIGRLLDGLEGRGLLDPSAFIVTADHGEAFLDHRLFMHQEVSDTLLEVPLIVRLPAASRPKSGSVEHGRVALEDIAPTVLELAGVALPPGLTGTSLPLPGRPNPPRTPRDFIGYYAFPELFSYRAFTLRSGAWKLVVHNPVAGQPQRVELFDLESDPGERSAVRNAGREEEMSRALRAWVREKPSTQGKLIGNSPAELEQVRSLGYID